MRIVRVRHLFYPDMPRDYFYELSARQASRGHEVDVVTWRRNCSCAEEITHDGFVVHGLPGPNISFFGVVQEYPYLPGLSAEIEHLDPDVVHAESHLFLTTAQAVAKAKKLRLPCVITVHGVFAKRGGIVDLAQRVYLRSIGLKALRAACSVVCMTRSDAEDIQKLGVDPGKIRLVRNAVDTELFRPSRERDDDLVVWVGRFVREKGLRYLVEAAKTVVRERQGVRFLLIGYGPLRTKIVNMARDFGLLGTSLQVMGPMDRSEVARALSRSAVFVFPSLKEGMPLSLLEAMASGNAVVASDIRGIDEIIRSHENGLLVPVRNPVELASSIRILLDDRTLRRRLSADARKTVEDCYSWDSTLAKLDSIYKSIEAV